MKKLMKKIKSNKLIPKLVAVLTICMVLLSSLTISSFAADVEVSAANEATDSITDTWTSVMNWITSSFGSVQGLFIEPVGSSHSIVLNSADIFEINNDDVYYLIELPGFDPSSAVFDDSYEFTVSDEVYSLTFMSFGDVNSFASTTSPFSLLSFTSLPPEFSLPIDVGSWYLQMLEPFSGSITLTSPFAFSGGLELSFLGTLAVIGVAIAIAFLLISVISRFLRLRG